MQLVITLRHREQLAIAFVHETLRKHGWVYDGFLPGIEFTNGSSTINLTAANFAYSLIDKDQWFSLLFHSESESVPEELLSFVVEEKRKVFSRKSIPIPLATRIESFPPIPALSEAAAELPPNDGTW